MISQSRLIKIVAGVLSLLCVVGCDFAKMKKCAPYVAEYIEVDGVKMRNTSEKMSIEIIPMINKGMLYNFLSEGKDAYKYGNYSGTTAIDRWPCSPVNND